MILISYDISDDKLRRQFAKYIDRFGFRLQYSVYEIEQSGKVLDNIMHDIQNRFERRFTENDSVLIFQLSKTCKILRFGYAKHLAMQNMMKMI